MQEIQVGGSIEDRGLLMVEVDTPKFDHPPKRLGVQPQRARTHDDSSREKNALQELFISV